MMSMFQAKFLMIVVGYVKASNVCVCTLKDSHAPDCNVYPTPGTCAEEDIVSNGICPIGSQRQLCETKYQKKYSDILGVDCETGECPTTYFTIITEAPFPPSPPPLPSPPPSPPPLPSPNEPPQPPNVPDISSEFKLSQTNLVISVVSGVLLLADVILLADVATQTSKLNSIRQRMS